MSEILRIGINADGGDNPMESVCGAFCGSVNKACQVQLYCTLEQSTEARDDKTRMIDWWNDRFLNIVECKPGQALCKALEDLAMGKIHALITATNSAALMRQTFRLNFWSRESPKPALIAPIPVANSQFAYLMDAGATARETNPQVFLDWAKMGVDFLQRSRGNEVPRIRLVNISTERAFSDLERIHQALIAIPGYEGYGEPEDFWRGDINLWLCDGYTGNLLLKQTEAVVKTTAQLLIGSLTDGIQKAQAMAVVSRMSYGEHLLSPFLLPNSLRIFRLHGNTPESLIGKAFWLACEKFKIGSDWSIW